MKNKSLNMLIFSTPEKSCIDFCKKETEMMVGKDSNNNIKCQFNTRIYSSIYVFIWRKNVLLVS